MSKFMLTLNFFSHSWTFHRGWKTEEDTGWRFHYHLLPLLLSERLPRSVCQLLACLLQVLPWSPKHDHLPICRTPIGQKCKVSINTLVIAPKVAVETNFGTNHLDPHHELDGNRIGDEDEDEDVARQLQNMINNLEAATPPRPPRKTST